MSPRVAVVVEQYWHRIPGGTGRAAHEILRELDRLDRFDLHGVAAAHPQAPPDESPFVPVVHHRIPRRLLYEGWQRFGRPRIPFDHDLIWAPAMVVPPKTAPTVVTVHDVDFLENPERLTRRGKSFFPRAWSVSLDRADLLVCSSADTAAAAIEHGAPEDKVRTVPLGVDTTRAEVDDVAAIRGRFGLPETFLLWVGTVEPRKNLAGLVEALRPTELSLAVVGPDGWLVDDRDVLAPLGDRAFRLGRVNQRDLRSLYAAATLFVFPSLAEGFGLPVLEAMAQGTAVVTSSGTATEETAGGAALLADPHDPQSIREAIEQGVADPDLRARLETLGFERAAANGWATTAASYGAVFDELLTPDRRQ